MDKEEEVHVGGRKERNRKREKTAKTKCERRGKMRMERWKVRERKGRIRTIRPEKAKSGNRPYRNKAGRHVEEGSD